MDKTLSKQEVKVILDNAPKGSNNGLIIQSLVNKGYKLEGFNDVPTPTPEQTNAQKGVSMAKNPPNVIAEAGKSIKNAFVGGLEQAKTGYEQAKNAENPAQLLEGSLKMGAGVVGSAFSPLAPVSDVINEAVVKPSANLISNTDLIKGAAGNQIINPDGTVSYVKNSSADRITEDIANLNAIIGAVAAGMKIKSDISTRNLLKTDIKESGTEYQKGGAVGPEMITNPDGTLKPQAVQHMVSDLKLKFNADQPGLGNLFEKTIDTSKPATIDSIRNEAMNFVKSEPAISFLGSLKNKVLGTTEESIKSTLRNVKQSRLLSEASQINDLSGKIVQGTPEDIATAQKALSSLDVSKVKTYKDLKNTIDTKIQNLSTELDKNLESSPIHNKPLLLGDLETSTTVGNKVVRHNFVEDAINQLKNKYEKTNNPVALEKINQLEQKANTEGITLKELNDLAKLHGTELNAFGANGEVSTGLSKQALENTRMGVKNTGRTIYGDKLYQATDAELTKLIRTKDLISSMEENVNKLKQKIQERGFGEKAGRLIFKVANIFTGGGLKGFVEASFHRGAGYKVLNALDLEEMLNSNLKKLQSAVKAKTELQTINKLNDILNQESIPARNILNVQPTTKINSKTSNIK